jgi:hypothetical protein
MRTSERIIFAVMLGALPVASAFAFDGAPVDRDATIPGVSGQQPGSAAVLKKPAPGVASADTSLTALQYAAEGGHPIAQWKLGRMYADGNGVAQPVGAAGGDRGQCLRGARALLFEWHSQLEDCS